jgi:predicted nucleic acid-binding protein
MKRYLADTSFLSALFNKDDINHLNAKKIAQEVKDEYFIIPAVVIAELSGFNRDLDLRDLLIDNSMTLASEISSFGAENIIPYLTFRTYYQDRLKTLDSIILFSAIDRGATLLTFDKELKKKYEMVCENLF